MIKTDTYTTITYTVIQNNLKYKVNGQYKGIPRVLNDYVKCTEGLTNTWGEQRKYYTEETISVFQSAHYTTLINDY